MRFSLLVIAVLFFCSACGGADKKPINTPPPANAPATPREIKDGDYSGKGKVTKVDLEMPSVELDHDEIAGLMPAMRMEFFVTDKALLKGIAVGDQVEFTILYKGGTETITRIGKTK